MSQDLEDAKQKIDDKYEEVQEANYYELLDVDESADAKTISNRFRNLAQTWHADRFSGVDLPAEYKEKVQEIFSEINNAQRTLTDEDKREEYDAELEVGDTDIGSVIDAESAFRRGRNLLDAGRNEGAHKQFEQAVELSPEEEPQYRAHYVYTEYLLIPKDDMGKPKDKERAREIFSEMDDIADDMQSQKPWLFAYMGFVCQGIGRRNEAESLYREALRYDSDNTLANRQLRLIEMRKEKDENKGFLDKILSKLNLN